MRTNHSKLRAEYLQFEACEPLLFWSLLEGKAFRLDEGPDSPKVTHNLEHLPFTVPVLKVRSGASSHQAPCDLVQYRKSWCIMMARGLQVLLRHDSELEQTLI